MGQYIDGVTEIPKPIPADKIKKQRELEQKQRYLERKIRKFKRFQVGSCDPETAKAYGKKVKEAQAELRELIKDNEPLIKRDYDREKVYENVKSQARKVDIFNDNEVPLNAELTSEKIVEELKTSKIGAETLKDIENLPQRIKLTYESVSDGVRGDERNGEIRIFLSNCKNVKWAARSVIHETTHWKYGISQSQWSESMCLAQELKHARNRDYLTISEKRTIIKAVKEAYPEFNWRKGGYVYGRKK